MVSSARNRVAVLLIGTAAACATSHHSSNEGAAGPPYPRRPSNCKLAVFQTPQPGVATWDDIGVAEVGCHLDVGTQQCMQRLKAEACRMGGDIIYAVPKKPLRPKDQVLVYRAQVAHTRVSKPDDEHAQDLEGPPSLPTGPIEPLVPRPVVDGGTDG